MAASRHIRNVYNLLESRNFLIHLSHRNAIQFDVDDIDSIKRLNLAKMSRFSHSLQRHRAIAKDTQSAVML